MKGLFTLLAVLLTIAVAFPLASCQKDDTAQSPAFVADRGAEKPSGDILDRIQKFKESIEHCQAHPGTKDATCLSIDDAVWNVETLFNYTYAYPELICSRARAYDSVLYLPVTHHDSVLMADLTLFYDRMYGAVGTIFQRDTLSNSQLLLLDVESGDILNDQVKITLHTLIGSVTGTPQQASEPQQPWPGPFAEGEWWFYGENLGGSGGSDSDAAKQLTWWLNYYLIPQAPDGCYYLYTDIVQKTSPNPTEHTYGNGFCEYYRSDNDGLTFPDDLILDRDELNFHYFGEKDLVRNRLYSDGSGSPTIHALFRVHVQDSCEIENSAYTMTKHWTTAWYGISFLVSNEHGHERGSLEP